MANDDLTQDQTEKLLQFQDLCGIEDIERCKNILQNHNWDIEVAVQDTFNEREGAPSVYTQPPPPPPREPVVNNQPPDQRIYTVQRQQPQGLVQWGCYVLLSPFRFFYCSILDLLRFAYRLIWPDPRQNVTDPIGDVIRFIRMYNETYGERHPTFYQGTYSQALNDAKRELRFLLVYLHGDDHQDTPQFCRETLSNQAVIDFVNGRMLFWACNINSPEGYRVSRALKENTYPFLGIIVLKQNRMTVVARIEGPIGSAELIEQLDTVMSDNEASIIAAQAERDERNITQNLRRQQDEAFLESLRADQEKERCKREELEKQALEEQKKKEEELKHQRMLQDRERRKEELRQQIPEEPPASDPDAIQILLKLPHGDRIQRCFLRSQSLKVVGWHQGKLADFCQLLNLQYLYFFAFCHEDCPDDFHIVTNYPRRTLECEPTDLNPEPKTFAEVGLGKSEMLFVQDNEA